MRRTWKKRTPEFKQQALERMQAAQDIGLAAKDLGVSVRTLYRWKDIQLGRPKKVREPEPREKSWKRKSSG
jgi:transposase-like protein